MVALWRVSPAFAAITIPKGGLDVFVFDFLQAHRIESPGRLEAGDSGYLYRVIYKDQETKWSRLINIGEPLDRAVSLMRKKETLVTFQSGRTAAALPYRIVVDFSEGTPHVSLAVQYFSGAVGSEIVPIEACSDLPKGNYPARVYDDTPHWKTVRVDFKGTHPKGRRNRSLTSEGKVFLYSGRQATELVPQVDFVYEATTADGTEQNFSQKLDRHDVIDAFTLFNFGQPLLVEHPKTQAIMAVVPQEVVVDLYESEPRVFVSVRAIGADPYNFEIRPSAMVGLANVFCASALNVK